MTRPRQVHRRRLAAAVPDFAPWLSGRSGSGRYARSLPNWGDSERDSRRSLDAAIRAPPSSPAVRLWAESGRERAKGPCVFSGRLPFAAELAEAGRAGGCYRQALALAEKLGTRRLVAYHQLGPSCGKGEERRTGTWAF